MNTVAGNVAHAKHFAPALAASLRGTCCRSCCCKQFGVSVAFDVATSCARFRCPNAFNRSVMNHTVNRQRVPRPIAALHRACTAAILTKCRPAKGVGSPGAGGRLQQYWVSNTGCPGPSGGPSVVGAWVRWLCQARSCDFILHFFPRRLPYLWFPAASSFPPACL